MWSLEAVTHLAVRLPHLLLRKNQHRKAASERLLHFGTEGGCAKLIVVSEDQPRPRVLLADDYAGILIALKRLLAPSCDVVGCVSDGAVLLETVIRLRPDVVILDVRMPSINGLEMCRQIKETTPATKVIVFTAADDAEIRRRAFEHGASAFVTKYRVADDLSPAIQKAFAG